MSELNCKYCRSPFSGERDENGELFCNCTEAQLERATARAAELEAENKRLREALEKILAFNFDVNTQPAAYAMREIASYAMKGGDE